MKKLSLALLVISFFGSSLFFNGKLFSQEDEATLKVRAWVDLEYKYDFVDNSNTFDQHHFYLIFDSNITDKLRAYAEVEYEHAGDTTEGGLIKLDRAWGSYTFKDFFGIKFGKYLIPYGVWNLEHWAPLTSTASIPIAFDNKYIPINSTGVQLFGNLFLPNVTVSYALYINNGKGAQPDRTDDNQNKAWGADLRATFFENYQFGISYWSGKNGKSSDRKEQIVNASIKLNPSITRIFSLDIIGEFQYQLGDVKFITYYAQPGMRFGDFGMYFRYDMTERDEKRGNSDKHRAVTGAINYLPIPYVRIKAEFTDHKYWDTSTSNEKVLIISTSILFN